MSGEQGLAEFDLIERFFAGVGPLDKTAAVTLGMGDDCALLSMDGDDLLALSIDTLVAGRHFPLDADAADLAQRALAVTVSDLAAMGATPVAFTLAITLPSIDTQWLQAFSDGLRLAANSYAIPLIGGDTTQGPLTITLQAHGRVAVSSVLKRSGAMAGDSIYVSGTLGDAAAALAVIEHRLSVSDAERDYLLGRFYRPVARIGLGQSLLGLASSAIDISDGLMGDLQHIAKASQLSARIECEQLPLSAVLQAVVSREQAIQYALSGGDDYELCFTAPPQHHRQLMALSSQLGIAVSRIGQVSNGEGVECVDARGQVVPLAKPGYRHFSG